MLQKLSPASILAVVSTLVAITLGVALYLATNEQQASNSSAPLDESVGETVAHDTPPPATSPSVMVSPPTTEDAAPTDENSPATDPLATVCADPERWYQWGAGVPDLVFAHLDQTGGEVARLDQVEVAQFERHSRDAKARAALAADLELAEAYRTSARMYAAAADTGQVSIDDALNLMHADRVVADRCDLLLAESDLK